MGELSYPDPPLGDPVVALRAWTSRDVAAVVAAFRDPLIQRFSVAGEEAVTDASVRAAFAEHEQARVAGEELNLALVAPGDPTIVLGGASLYDIDLAQARGGIGYWVAPAARGRGVATHATRLMAGWAFAALGLQRLELTCGPDNERSQRVAERCGFVREGVLRSHLRWKGGRRDTVMFGLLPGELR